MFNLENLKTFNLVKIDGEIYVISHEDLMTPSSPFSQGQAIEYVGSVNIPNKYLEKQQPIEPINEVF